MTSTTNEDRAEQFLEVIKPELMKILATAPAFGSCGMEIQFNNSEIVGIDLKAHVCKVKSIRKPGKFVVVREPAPASAKASQGEKLEA